ncbi:MAG TPA: NAD-dependent epimerase/dehydratase family protein [Anaeromyxobacter sp.]|nr:NAD-dependent epimerase/dehydratase family protein [Anaeromyxobacter sp.]
MRVLIIGGNRFVGRSLASRLLASGQAVTLLNRGRLADPFGDRVERLVCDRTSPELERVLLRRTFDAVVDLAAFTGEDGRRAAALLRDRAGHYLMVSTGQVYLVRESCPRPAREEDYHGPLMRCPTDPADLAEWEYGMGKRACEDALAAAGRDGLPETRVRIPMVNGPLDYFRRIESYLWRLVDGGPMIVPDGGTHRLRHVDGSEVARFIELLLGRKEAMGRAFNLAQEETPTLFELVTALRDLTGSRAPLLSLPTSALRAAGLDPLGVSPFSGRWMSFLDPSRARDEMGFFHAPLATCLAGVVGSFFAQMPADRPKGYERRTEELSLARAHRGPHS